MLLPILLAIGLPIAVACLLLLAGWLVVRRDAARALPWWSVAGAVGFGYAAGHFSLSGWPKLPPGDVTHWLPFVAILGFVCAGVLSFSERAVAVWTARALVALAITLLLYPMSRSASMVGAAAVVAIMLGVQLVWFAAFEQLNRAFKSWEFLATLLIFSVACSFALVLSRSALLGQLAGSMAAAIGPVAFGAIVWRRRTGVWSRSLLSIVPVLAGLLLLGHQFAYLPVGPALLLAAAPVAAAAVTFARYRPVVPVTVRAGAFVLMLAVIAGALYWITRSLPVMEAYEF